MNEYLKRFVEWGLDGAAQRHAIFPIPKDFPTTQLS